MHPISQITTAFASLVIIAVLVIALADAKECWDLSYKCPTMRQYCASETVKAKCPLSCGKCKVKYGMSDELANAYIKGCCDKNNMTKDCLPLCRYDTSQAELLTKSDKCLNRDGEIWLMCATAGKDNSECCRDVDAANCIDFCKGIYNTEKVTECVLNHWLDIEQCLRNSLP